VPIAPEYESRRPGARAGRKIKFTEWTSDDQLRQPVFLGLRTDKQAKDVVREDIGLETPTTTIARLDAASLRASNRVLRAASICCFQAFCAFCTALLFALCVFDADLAIQ
jgi:hypothetical protein